MKDFRKDAEADLVGLWKKLERKGFKPIENQFQFLMGKKKGDLLTNIRSALKSYSSDPANFNADGTLNNYYDLFPIHLCVEEAVKKKDEVLTSINFSLDYSPENGVHISRLYMLRINDTHDIIQINIKHKPNEPPPVKNLHRLMEKTDQERIRKNEGSITKEVDLSNALRNRMKL